MRENNDFKAHFVYVYMNYTSYTEYTKFSGDTEILFSKFLDWASDKGIFMQIVKMPDSYGYYIRYGDNTFIKTGFKYWFQALDKCVDKVFQMTDGIDYINEMISYVYTLDFPDTKEESIFIHKEMLIKCAENIKEVLQMIVEGDFINEKCDNRIKDAILCLIIAKESI